jgi:hypothetical protein
MTKRVPTFFPPIFPAKQQKKEKIQAAFSKKSRSRETLEPAMTQKNETFRGHFITENPPKDELQQQSERLS